MFAAHTIGVIQKQIEVCPFDCKAKLRAYHSNGDFEATTVDVKCVCGNSGTVSVRSADCFTQRTYHEKLQKELASFFEKCPRKGQVQTVKPEVEKPLRRFDFSE